MGLLRKVGLAYLAALVSFYLANILFAAFGSGGAILRSWEMAAIESTILAGLALIGGAMRRPYLVPGLVGFAILATVCFERRFVPFEWPIFAGDLIADLGMPLLTVFLMLRLRQVFLPEDASMGGHSIIGS